MKTIYLTAGIDYLQFDELAHRIATALFPLDDSASDSEMMAYGGARINLEAELLQAVKSGTLPVRDPLTFGPHSYPRGDALKTALVSVNDLRVFLAGRPIAIESEPLQTAATPAPVVADGASGGVKPDKAGPLPLTTGDISFCFAGLRWNEQQWRKPLGDKPKWLAPCIAIPGVRGVSQTRWNPVLIGAALEREGHAKQNSIRARFQTMPQLAPWCDAWKTYEADNFDTE